MNNNCRQEVTNKMMAMGFHISSKGFNYIIEAARIISESEVRPKMTGGNGVYDIVAERFSTTAARVERCIRHEIVRYYNTSMDIPKELTCDFNSGKLTNSEFLVRFATILYAD